MTILTTTTLSQQCGGYGNLERERARGRTGNLSTGGVRGRSIIASNGARTKYMGIRKGYKTCIQHLTANASRNKES